MNVRSIFRLLSYSPGLVPYTETPGAVRGERLFLKEEHVKAIQQEDTSHTAHMHHLHMEEGHSASWVHQPPRPTDNPAERPGVLELMLMTGMR